MKCAAIFLSLIFGLITAQDVLPLIPYPQKVERGTVSFHLDKGCEIISDTRFEAEFLRAELKNGYGVNIKISKKPSARKGIFLKKDSNLPENKYLLKTDGTGVLIKGKSAREIFYGVQSLLQIIRDDNGRAYIPSVSIEDAPKFSWRGMHLDCARHFFPKEFVKKYIDYIAAYKMNVFHWHLTDDQGWRIEIKKYPKLTEVGAWRSGSMVGPYKNHTFDDNKYGGFYSQEDIRELVRYAAKRHITIVPEIEMPGHATAAIAAYPFLGSMGRQIAVQKEWGVFDDIFSPKEKTFAFLENVLTEVMQLFPSRYIHIGGDEVPKNQWKADPYSQSLIKKLNLKDEEGLQSYFVQRIENFLAKHGRKAIGWDEILQGGIAKNAAIMSWQGEKGGIAAAVQHHDAVMTPTEFCYFNFYQGDDKTEPLAFADSFLPLKKVYSYNPLPQNLSAENQKYILGTQGNLWSEYILDEKQAEYQLFPRICALSEVAWGTSKPNGYDNFRIRLLEHQKLLDRKKINYSKTFLVQ